MLQPEVAIPIVPPKYRDDKHKNRRTFSEYVRHVQVQRHYHPSEYNQYRDIDMRGIYRSSDRSKVRGWHKREYAHQNRRHVRNMLKVGNYEDAIDIVHKNAIGWDMD